MSNSISIISAGAAMGLVRSLLTGQYDEATSSFGAVGAMQDKFLAGEACDLLILARHQLDALAEKGLVRDIQNLGQVSTGLAVCSAASTPKAHDAASLREALLQATQLYVPDTQRSTAGQHVARMLEKLGIAEQMKGKISEHPNGVTAMKAMAATGDLQAIGCTQATEILYTPGVRYVGALPSGFELATMYSAAVPTRCARQETARLALQTLCATEAQATRLSAGFQ